MTLSARNAPAVQLLAAPPKGEPCLVLADKGITLDIQEYDDYVIPNTIVEDGQCDTNYFQHQPYLDNFNEEKGTHLVSVAGIHVEPMGIYGGKQSDLSPIEG